MQVLCDFLDNLVRSFKKNATMCALVMTDCSLALDFFFSILIYCDFMCVLLCYVVIR